ncbi:MAG: hypothetical protein OEV40_16700 [Acidimicrobiia bacterium]|nr:hypothetical protein [Acidimicrobiia bacterium]
MLKLQIITMTALAALAATLRLRLGSGLRDERGEITSTVAIIGVLVVGALAAGAIVVARMQAHANAIPNPGG